MAIEVETYFVVTVTKEGGFVTYTKLPEEDIVSERQATAGDVLTASKQLIQEIEQKILVDRITASIVDALDPPVATVPDKIKDALKHRGIDVESQQ